MNRHYPIRSTGDVADANAERRLHSTTMATQTWPAIVTATVRNRAYFFIHVSYVDPPAAAAPSERPNKSFVRMFVSEHLHPRFPGRGLARPSQAG